MARHTNVMPSLLLLLRFPALMLLASLLLLTKSSGFHLQPSKVSFDKVSQSYPETWFRTLFSSVPRREFALEDFSFEFTNGFWVVIGASSSGKSTILRLLSGQEEPVSGEIVFDADTGGTSTPVYLQQEKLKASSWKQLDNNNEMSSYLAQLVNIDLTKPPSTTSDLYKYELVRASLESISSTAAAETDEPTTTTTTKGPILLLDEWMDLETSDTVHKVESAIVELVQKAGAVVVCVTHKPNLFASQQQHQSVLMCRGKLLKSGTLLETSSMRSII